MESEYVAPSQAIKELLWLISTLKELNNPIDSIQLLKDNQAAIQVLRNPGKFHPRTKHINIRYHFVRDEINKNDIEIKYIPTNDMIADFLTKPSTRLENLERINLIE